MYPEALLFDMDGVLVDSTESWRGALNGALREYSQPELTRDKFLRDYWGADLFEILENLGLDLGIGRFCNCIYPNYIGDVKLFPEVVETLKELSPYSKAVVTNTTYVCTKQILEKHDIERYFNHVVTSDQVKRGKPHPDMIFLACEKLDLDPKDVVMIGDTINDVKAGKEAGCMVIGIGVEANHSLDSIAQLPQLIEKIKR